MATRPRAPREQEPPPDWTPTQAVDEPVINNPYDEPTKHWVYKGGTPFKMDGRRRASYYFKTKRTGSAQQELIADEQSDDLPLVNRLRDDVKRWRDKKYQGASNVTKELLAYWTRPDRLQPLFFCQREAAETIIYLLEIAIPGRLASTGYKNFRVEPENLNRLLKGDKPTFDEIRDFCPTLVDIPADSGLLGLRRLGCKMATGSGKTIVMAMVVTWAFCNRGRNPATAAFPNGVLICAPNITVRNRLAVLRPDQANNYYDQFELIPAKYRDLMGTGRVLITNWHGFAPKSPHREGDVSYKVVDKGDETADAFTIDRLGELASRLPILVLNDEGHHCWRPKPQAELEGDKSLSEEQRKELKEEAEEARVWLAGLDRINNSGLIGKDKPAVLACVDLSATPFYLANSGYDQGSPFPWLVSDFGLVDAIESGIVKIPRLPVKDATSSRDDAGRPDPKYFRLWRHIDDTLKSIDRNAKRQPKPEAVYREAEGALITLYEQWDQKFAYIQAKTPGERVVPPTLIVVCDNTEIAKVFHERISGEKVVEIPTEDRKSVVERTTYQGSPKFPQFANEEGRQRTVRIDSDLLKKIEVEEGETKDKAALSLRAIIDTVGRSGGPGEQVRCVVSVSMLTEGWDATNVTHILGVRAFESQLLCEQVVGRGLRRMSYRPDPETKMLPAEYVDVYGIPFSLIPFKGRPKDADTNDPVYNHIFAVPERANLEIKIPVVEGYHYELRDSGIRCDFDKLEPLIINKEPTEVYLAFTRGYQEDPNAPIQSDFIQQDRQNFYERVRLQQIVFKLSQLIVEKLVAGSSKPDKSIKEGVFAKHQIFPEIVRIVSRYVDEKVMLGKGVTDKRELALEKYARELQSRILAQIAPAAAREDAPLLPITNSFKPYYSTTDVNYRTTRPVIPLQNSHLNSAAFNKSWEKQAIELIDDLDIVDAFTPNDRNIGLIIPYEYEGGTYNYEPDFIVRMRGDHPKTTVIVEIKGGKGEIHDEDRVPAKNAGAKKWATAVTNTARYGRWVFEICKDLSQLRKILERYVERPIVVPFRRVENPKPLDKFKTCVPLTTLRAAAGRWSEEQFELDTEGNWADEWITYDTRTRFQPGMFVAQVIGDSMEPDIPNRSYCLFRPVPAGSRQGRRLIVWYSGLTDPESGGHYTLKVYTSEKAVDTSGSWQHTNIVLKPLNPRHQPITLAAQDEGKVRAVAEFVEVIGVPELGKPKP